MTCGTSNIKKYLFPLTEKNDFHLGRRLFHQIYVTAQLFEPGFDTRIYLYKSQGD